MERTNPVFPKNRAPITAGETLERTFLDPQGMSREDLSKLTGMSKREINAFIRGDEPCTADIAIRLSSVFETEPGFWMSVQENYDMWLAHDELQELSAN